jgi:hypothetical protein
MENLDITQIVSMAHSIAKNIEGSMSTSDKERIKNGDIDVVTSQIAGMMNSMGGFGITNAEEDDSNIRLSTSISFEDLVNGKEKTVKYKRYMDGKMIKDKVKIVVEPMTFKNSFVFEGMGDESAGDVIVDVRYTDTEDISIDINGNIILDSVSSRIPDTDFEEFNSAAKKVNDKLEEISRCVEGIFTDGVTGSGNIRIPGVFKNTGGQTSVIINFSS